MAVKVLAGQASSILSQARAAAWLPELPPKASAAASPYISEILQYLEVQCLCWPTLHVPAMSCMSAEAEASSAKARGRLAARTAFQSIRRRLALHI
jgi:hypothetical protein